MVSGSLMTWAFYSEGPAERWIRDDVNAVLAPYLRAGAHESRKRRTKGH